MYLGMILFYIMKMSLKKASFPYQSKFFCINLKFLTFISNFCDLFFRLERSTDQVIKPINLEALSKWVGNIPKEVAQDIETIAPMLRHFGYDMNCDAANYGTPDKELLDRMNSQTDEEKSRWSEKEMLAIKERENYIAKIKAKHSEPVHKEDHVL